MKDFEKNLSRLDEIIARISDGSTLADSLDLYKEGLALVTESADSLNTFESEVKILRLENGEVRFDDFGERFSNGDDEKN